MRIADSGGIQKSIRPGILEFARVNVLHHPLAMCDIEELQRITNFTAIFIPDTNLVVRERDKPFFPLDLLVCGRFTEISVC